MSDIANIDPNFAVKPVNEDGLVYYSCQEEPFRVYGLFLPDEQYPYFRRMPQEIADSVSERVGFLAKNSAGGRVRFRTDSCRIAIRAKFSQIYRASHMAFLGSAGFDLYVDTTFFSELRPPHNMKDGYSSEIQFPDKKLRDITINFPLYSTVSELEIGLEEGAQLVPGGEYKVTVPVVYYGSSITQGGCASRPGCSYQSIISRRMDCDYVNLGFSGSAKAENAIANYIAGLDMSVFVYDYDHNAPNVEYLEQTHEKMFHTIRQAKPDLPIVMVTRPRAWLKDHEFKRREIIMKTFLNAKAAGDQNVYFVDGSTMLNIFGGDCGTVDGVHPNDLGFACMAKAIGDTLENIL